MKKLISACAVCALAVGLVAVPSAMGVKSPKQVGGAGSITVTPNPLPNTTTTATVSGNVASSSGCRKDRTIHFAWVNGTTVGPDLGVVATTRSNGDYTATVPRPTDTAPTTTSVTLRATVDALTRKVGSKKKGKKTKKGRVFNCMTFTSDSAAVTLTP